MEKIREKRRERRGNIIVPSCKTNMRVASIEICYSPLHYVIFSQINFLFPAPITISVWPLLLLLFLSFFPSFSVPCCCSAVQDVPLLALKLSLDTVSILLQI